MPLCSTPELRVCSLAHTILIQDTFGTGNIGLSHNHVYGADGHNLELSFRLHRLKSSSPCNHWKRACAATYCTNIVFLYLHLAAFNTFIATIKPIIQLPVDLLPVEFPCMCMCIVYTFFQKSLSRRASEIIKSH